MCKTETLNPSNIRKRIAYHMSEMDKFEQSQASIFKLLTEPTTYDFKGYKICHNELCHCTGKCINKRELDKARAIVKEFG